MRAGEPFRPPLDTPIKLLDEPVASFPLWDFLAAGFPLVVEQNLSFGKIMPPLPGEHLFLSVIPSAPILEFS